MKYILVCLLFCLPSLLKAQHFLLTVPDTMECIRSRPYQFQGGFIQDEFMKEVLVRWKKQKIRFYKSAESHQVVTFSEVLQEIPEIAVLFAKKQAEFIPPCSYQFGIFQQNGEKKFGYIRIHVLKQGSSFVYYFDLKDPFPWEKAILKRDYGAIREHSVSQIVKEFLCNYCMEGKTVADSTFIMRIPAVSSKSVRLVITKSDSTLHLFPPVQLVLEKIIQKKLNVLNESKQKMIYANIMSDLKSQPAFDSLRNTKRLDLAVKGLELIGVLTRKEGKLSFTPEYLSVIWLAPSGPFEDFSLGLISWKQLPKQQNWLAQLTSLQFPFSMVCVNDVYPQTKTEMDRIQQQILSGTWENLPVQSREYVPVE